MGPRIVAPRTLYDALRLDRALPVCEKHGTRQTDRSSFLMRETFARASWRVCACGAPWCMSARIPATYVAMWYAAGVPSSIGTSFATFPRPTTWELGVSSRASSSSLSYRRGGIRGRVAKT